MVVALDTTLLVRKIPCFEEGVSLRIQLLDSDNFGRMIKTAGWNI
jgi:hypothetical protein